VSPIGFGHSWFNRLATVTLLVLLPVRLHSSLWFDQLIMASMV